jgi:ABC-2 type transport system permease protein
VIWPATRGDARALVAFMGRQKSLVRRYWAWEVALLFYSVVNVLSIGYLAAGLGLVAPGVGSGDLRDAQLYLLVGSLLWGYLWMVFLEVAYAIIWERWEGTIEYTFMAPVRRFTHLLGVGLFALVYGLARTLATLVVASLLFHLDLSRSDLLAAAAVLVASTPALMGIAILAAVLPMLSPEKGEQMTFALESVILLLSGVYYPISVLPAPLQLLAAGSPLTYTLAGIRESMLHGRHLGDQVGTLALLLAMGGLLVPLGLLVFAAAERRAKRLGLLKRSG